MRLLNTIHVSGLILALLAALLLSGTMQATAQTPTVTDLYSFTNDNWIPPSIHVIQASDGALYCTTSVGGASSDGDIFKITPSGVFTTLHAFSGGSDGRDPFGSLIQAGDGALYGTTNGGGANGNGTVFKITTSGALTTLHSFNAFGLNDSNSDGAYPAAIPLQANDGNLYGTTQAGGVNGNGTIFKTTTSGTFTTLYSFSASTGDGSEAGLIQATDGALYGMTVLGGTYNQGTIFRITTAGVFTTLYSFTYGNDGGEPTETGLVQASDGNLYGATAYAGANGDGTLFRITTSGTLTTLYAFGSRNGDGFAPHAGLIQASDGSLYGTTISGGAYGFGTVFRITTAGALTTLYSFDESDGADLEADLIQGSDGCLYGTTRQGGVNGWGRVYRLSGIYRVPVLTGISPSSTNAAGPAFALKVTGSSFQSFSKVNWNGSPLTTTYVSPTALSAFVPASLIAAPGKTTLTVVTGAGGGTSKSKAFTLLTTALKLSAAKLTRDSGTGIYTASLTLKNAGYLTAPSVQITKTSLGSTGTTTTLPMSLGSVAKGKTVSTSLGFPASAGASGSVVVLKVSGTFTGGTFSGSLNVKLP